MSLKTSKLLCIQYYHHALWMLYRNVSYFLQQWRHWESFVMGNICDITHTNTTILAIIIMIIVVVVIVIIIVVIIIIIIIIIHYYSLIHSFMFHYIHNRPRPTDTVTCQFTILLSTWGSHHEVDTTSLCIV
jgi:hypothetical protein